jgi:methylenetetrahydrofolate dehydrogenase (NADP+) / methenyltetrahydrofolate cyclohydrolase
MTYVIDGKGIAAVIREQTARSAALLRERGVIPALAVVVPTKDESAAWYVRSIERAADAGGD